MISPYTAEVHREYVPVWRGMVLGAWLAVLFLLSHYKSVGANAPLPTLQGEASLHPRGLIGRIYVGDHYTLLHTKYISSGPHGFREENFFKFFPLYVYGI